MSHVLLSFLPWVLKVYHFMVCCQTCIEHYYFGIAVKGLAKDRPAMIWLRVGEFGFFSLVMSRFILPVQMSVRDGRAV